MRATNFDFDPGNFPAQERSTAPFVPQRISFPTGGRFVPAKHRLPGREAGSREGWKNRVQSLSLSRRRHLRRGPAGRRSVPGPKSIAMIYRSKAPLRIGLAGGGTDVSPYSDLYGGAILNATVSLYAHATIEPTDEPQIVLRALDRNQTLRYELQSELPIDGVLDLHKGIYNHVVSQFGPIESGFSLNTFVDAPAGSGLGSSSTLVVAILGAFAQWLRLPLGSYDVAQRAYRIERDELGMAGGKQDQYAATFGGFNYMEFYDDRVIVNPLRIKREYINELENNLLLYYTSKSRVSAEIIEQQQQNVLSDNRSSVEAMHVIKQQAAQMKEALLTRPPEPDRRTAPRRVRLQEAARLGHFEPADRRNIRHGAPGRSDRREDPRRGRRRIHGFLLPRRQALRRHGPTEIFRRRLSLVRLRRGGPLHMESISRTEARLSRSDRTHEPFTNA